MNPLFAAAADVQTFCHAQGWTCSVIGGLAVQRWGEPRQTRDVDFTLLTGRGGEARFIELLLDRYAPRIPNARQFALDHRVVLVMTSSGVPIDIALTALPFEVRIIERSTPFDFEPGAGIVTCSAEDLVVLKAFAGRPQDWLDVEGIIVRQGRSLDRALVLAEVAPLLQLKDDTESEAALTRLFDKHSHR
jgi:hypothetical protein